MRLRRPLPTLTLAALGLAALLTDCGGRSGVLPSAQPGTPPSAASVVPAKGSSQAMSVTRSAVTLSTLPVLTDTDPSTAGVFLGEDCGPKAVVSCPNFSNTFRHSLALGTVYSSWGKDLAQFISSSQINTWPAQGITPEITWQPMSTTSTVTYAAINSGAYDAYLKTSADELKAFGSTIFLRPFHEFNGTWYPWSLSNNGSDAQADLDFISAWRRMVTIFQQEGATNVEFVWCYSNSGMPSETLDTWNQPGNAYPGDAYVNWIGIDGYNRATSTSGTWRSFDNTMSPGYAQATAMAPTKPIVVAELASNEYGDGGTLKSEWIAQMLSELQSPTSTDKYPNIRAVSWFDSDSNGYLYDLESTSPAYLAWVDGIRSTSATGSLNFRGNGSALDAVTSP